VKPGDVVRVNTLCDAGGLWNKIGIVLEVGTYCIDPTMHHIDNGMRADVMMDGRQRRLASYSLDVITKST
jgi:hypothetical protein